jgi:hypothetical protein
MLLLLHVQGFVDLAYTPDGALVEENARVWQFSLALVRAEGVGPTGQGFGNQLALVVS